MTPLKEILEAIWNDSSVRCPRHVVLWTHTTRDGVHTERVTGELEEPLYYSKGKLTPLAKRKPLEWPK